jgi:MoxR-like ATPase
LEEKEVELSIGDVRSIAQKVLSEVNKVIVGKLDILQNIFIALLAGGHVLLEGVPGVAKTVMAKTFSDTLGCEFKRIQFTPDLLPADIIGTNVYDQKSGKFYLRKGPIFANIVLADEINRAPPKTQSALLECMQEKQVTIEGETHYLPRPFMVLATQNPIELEGTYPLPEAQVDRFFFKLIVDYPNPEEELEILKRKNVAEEAIVEKVASPQIVIAMQEAVKKVYVDDSMFEYIKNIVLRTRNHPQILLGASTRASIVLLYASKARAAILGRDFVIPDDIKSLAFPVLNHRIILKPEAELEGISAGRIINEILEEVEVPA